MNIVGIGISTLDSVQLATSRYGLSNYTFQTTSWGLSQDFGVVLGLEEHSPELFEWSASMELVIGQTGELVKADPIGDAPPAELAQIIIANSYPINISITSVDTTGAASISVSAHARRYSDKDVAVASHTLTGLMNSTTYYLFYDDPSRVGGAVAIGATVDYPAAFNSSAQPGRHYVGSIDTAATGGGQTGGGGGTPPGGGGSQNPNVVEP